MAFISFILLLFSLKFLVKFWREIVDHHHCLFPDFKWKIMLAVRFSQLPYISLKTFSSNEVKWKSLSHVRLFVTHGLNSPWDSLGQNTGVGRLSFFQGIFPTQGLNPGLPHGRRILYQLSRKGSPRILEWVAYPFSTRSSWASYQTGASCIAGGFLTTELSGDNHGWVSNLSS